MSATIRRRAMIAATAGAAVLLAGACGQAGGAEQPVGLAAAVTTDDSPTRTATPTQDVRVSQKEAVGIAKNRVGGGQVTEIEWEVEHGRTEWKVELVRDGVECEVRVDATTGAITRTEVDDGSDDRDSDRDDGHGDEWDDDGRHGGDDDSSDDD